MLIGLYTNCGSSFESLNYISNLSSVSKKEYDSTNCSQLTSGDKFELSLKGSSKNGYGLWAQDNKT